MSTHLHGTTPEEIEAAARHLAGGGLVIFPTETYYGIGCDPRRADAVHALFETKKRPAARALPLVAGSLEQVALAAPGWSELVPARLLAEVFWPGPLSLVLDAGPDLAPELIGEDGSVAVRWTPEPVAAALALATGFPVVATSANRTGSKARRYAAEALASLRYPSDVFVLDGGPTIGGLPSTLVDVRGSAPRLVRAGAIDERAIRTALAPT